MFVSIAHEEHDRAECHDDHRECDDRCEPPFSIKILSHFFLFFLTPFSLYLLFVETCLERWTMESAGRGFDSRARACR